MPPTWLRHCTRCDLEWTSSNVNCWLCGCEGKDGSIKNSDNNPFVWNGQVNRLSEPIEEGMVLL